MLDVALVEASKKHMVNGSEIDKDEIEINMSRYLPWYSERQRKESSEVVTSEIFWTCIVGEEYGDVIDKVYDHIDINIPDGYEIVSIESFQASLTEKG